MGRKTPEATTSARKHRRKGTSNAASRKSYAQASLATQHPDPFRQKIGEGICLMMEKHSITRAELANQLHISATAVTMWQVGHTEPSSENMRELADMWDISLDWLWCQDLLHFTPDELRGMRRTLPSYPRRVGNLTVCAAPL